MKKLAFLILPLLMWPSHSMAKSFGDYEGAVYARNYDGDTFTLASTRLRSEASEKGEDR